MKIKEHIKNILDHMYVFINRLRLKNHGFSLFANDCIGGVITHNVGEPFNSPTVNLFFESPEGYLLFLEHLKEYSGIPVEYLRTVEAEDLGHSYPVGFLPFQGREDIIIHFMHYKSFYEASKAWERRCARIRYDNSFAIIHFHEWNDDMKKLLKRFASLPLKGKLAIAYRGTMPVDESMGMGGYELFIHSKVKEYSPGILLKWKNRLRKRWIDDFDYVGWLNGSRH